MHKISLNGFFKKIDSSIDQRDGNLLSEYLSFRDNHVTNSNLIVEHPEKDAERYFEPPLDELVAAHLRGCWALSSNDYVETYKCQCLVLQAFTKILQSQKEENWSLPTLFSLSLDLRLLAYKADDQIVLANQSKKGECLEKAAEVLMGCFRICASDNRAQPEDSKKWGMLNLVNQLFKIYFKINKLHLCKPLIRAIDSLPFKEKFSISQLVTYRYYVGKKAMFESDFKSAEEYLSFAFQHCHRNAKKNKRLILIYLLPVKMLLGYMPNSTVLLKYNLIQFSEVAKAVRLGDLKLFKNSIAKNERFFIKCGVYLILEKLKIIAYRNLIKKVSIILNTHQMSMAAFTDAFKWLGEDVDEDEMQCILANLIYEDKIKGYLSYQHKKLVVSKQNAFPTLPIKLKA